MNKLLAIFGKSTGRTVSVSVPSYRQRVIRAERAFMDEIHTHRSRVAYDGPATELLVELWDELMALLQERDDPTRCSESGVEETQTLVEKIWVVLEVGADPNAVKARDLIRVLGTTRSFFVDGAVTALQLLTDLVESGYRVSGEEIDDLARGSSFRIFQPVNGAEWLAAANPRGFLTIGITDVEEEIASISRDPNGKTFFVCSSQSVPATFKQPCA